MKKETQNEMNELLKQIRNILIVIACILLVNVIVTGMNSNPNTNNTSTGSEENNLPEYDVSNFKEITVDEMFTEVNASGYKVVYVGREGCGYCRLFLDALNKAQTNFKYQTLYIDLDKVTNDGATKMQGISDEMKENFGYTPMVIVFKDGVYQDVWVGYDEYSSFEAFLTGLGMKISN